MTLRVGTFASLLVMAASLSGMPSAAADPADGLTEALMAVRGVACGPLKSDPIVQQTAAEVNDSTDQWINHTARAAPVSEALPLLHDLGYQGSKATIVHGAGRNSADAVKALMLQGYRSIPDCSYRDFGASMIYNDAKGVFLTIVVLAA
ncbi:hypothetical protein [Mycobacterium kyogaense]|uniref:hypothetical protein n=1 Tax=Mycobacterium kyogaense TaxID=2212479 RepID=UPI000DAE9571|nr:hypothetical protein [Mycobacterium kyogaense]